MSARVASGEFVAARTLFEQCLCHEGFQIRSDAAYRAVDGPQLPEDEHAVTHGHLAQTLAFLGHIDQARTRANQALSEAHRLQHADVLAFVLFSACRVEWVAGSPHDVQRYAEQAVALSSQHDFAFWLSYATIYRLWSLTALGQAQEVALLAKGLSAGRDTGAVVNVPEALMMLAGAYAQLGRSIEGLDCLTEAAQIIGATDTRCVEAESYRLRGDLLNGTGDRAAAEQNYRLALAVAERQSAKTFELRAATSLARLWRDQGKRAKACNLLAPIYGWFTEGFDTPVLKDAKELLDQLA